MNTESTNIEIKSNARLATLEELERSVIPNFFTPPPCRDTLRNWFDMAKIPRFKSNSNAKRGGGKVWYSVPHVEKLFRSKIAIK